MHYQRNILACLLRKKSFFLLTVLKMLGQISECKDKIGPKTIVKMLSHCVLPI